MPKVKSVPEMLRESAAVFEQRAKVYGDNFRKYGKVMHALYPDGLTLKGENDFNRYGILVQVVSKVTRYAENFERGGHFDSLVDLSVYCTMLRMLDAELPGSPDVSAKTYSTEETFEQVTVQRKAKHGGAFLDD